MSRRTAELHDVIAGAACVVSSRLHPASLAAAPAAPGIGVANPKMTETFASMGRGGCVIDPADATPYQIAAAVLEAQAAPATWEIEEA